MEGAVRFTKGDAISAAVLAGLGGYIVLQARQWQYMAEDGPGPGFFPIWYGIALIILSLGVVGARIYRSRQGATPDKPRTAEQKRGIAHALMVWAAFAICIALLEVLGFLLAFGLLTAFIVAVIYGRSWLSALTVAFATSLGFYLVFPLALSVALPVGVLGF